MDAFIECILDGSLAVETAVRWALAESDEVPAPVTPQSDRNTLSGTSWLGLPVPLVPSLFRRYVLEIVKEEALDILIAAGEGDASSGLKGATEAAAGEPSSCAAACPATKLPQIRAAEAPPIPVRPGHLDNDNFPALGLKSVPHGFHAQGSQRKIQPTRVPAAEIDQRFMAPLPRAQPSSIASTSSFSCVTPTRGTPAGATHLGSTSLTPQQGRSLQRTPSGAAFASAARLATAAGFPKENDRSPAANLERLMAGGDMEARSSPFAAADSRAERSGRLPLSASIAGEEPLRQPQWPDLGQPSAASSRAANGLVIAHQRTPVKAPAAWLRATHSLPAPGAPIGLHGNPCDVLSTKSADAAVIKSLTNSEVSDRSMMSVIGVVEGLRSAPARRVAPVRRVTPAPVTGGKTSQSWGAPVKGNPTIQGCRQDTILSAVSSQHVPQISISGRSVLSKSSGGAWCAATDGVSCKQSNEQASTGVLSLVDSQSASEHASRQHNDLSSTADQDCRPTVDIPVSSCASRGDRGGESGRPASLTDKRAPRPCTNDDNQSTQRSAPTSSTPSEHTDVLNFISKPSAGERNAAEVELTRLADEGRRLRLAQLHAAVLSSSASAALGTELDVLLHLVALPPGVTGGNGDVSKKNGSNAARGLLNESSAAAAYACAVLQNAGRLAESLGPSVLDALLACPALLQHAPALHSLLTATVEAARQQQHRLEKARKRLSVGRPDSSTSRDDSQRLQPKDEQRQVHNRETVRDEWLALMRDAAAAGDPFSSGTGNTSSDAARNGGYTSVSHQLSAGSSPTLRGDAAASIILQLRAPGLVQKLRLDNFGAFAEIFCLAVMQAATTGETLMDEQLSQLAASDPSRLHRLNQRMQSAAVPDPTRRTAPASIVSAAGSAALRAAQAAVQQSAPSYGARSQGNVVATAATIAALTAVAEFPPAQHLYLLFLAAVDSHRLNTAIMRVMKAKLMTLCAECVKAEGTVGLGERLAAMTCFASFLSFLAFEGTADGEWNDSGYSGLHPVDVRQALADAGSQRALLWTLPWAARYLWFLPPAVKASPYFRDVILHLNQLHQMPQLRPASEHFGRAALCLRCILDDLLARLAPLVVATVEGQSPEDVTHLHLHHKAASATVDARYVEMCCPLLEQGRRVLQASVAGRGWGQEHAAGARALRKITPTVPSSVAAALRAQLQVPPAMSQLLLDVQESVHVRLQAAFLSQYSTDAQPVRLKDVVEFVSDAVSANAARAVMGAGVAAAVEEAVEELAQMAAAVWTASPPRADLPQLQAARIMAASEPIIGRSTTQALEICHQTAKRQIERNAVRSLVALAAPDWSDDVVATAAALAAEMATVSCISSLLIQVPAEVRRQVTQKAVQLAVAPAPLTPRASPAKNSTKDIAIVSSLNPRVLCFVPKLSASPSRPELG